MRSPTASSAPLSTPLISRSNLLAPFSFLHRSPRFYLYLTLATLCLMLGLTALLALTLTTPTAAPHATAAAAASTAPPPAQPPAGPPTTSVLTALASYPHDSSCFTQGLEWHDGTLYESCGMYGASSLRTVDLATGRSLTSRSLDARYFAEGITVAAGRVYQLTWRERDVLVWDAASLTQLATQRINTDGWGIAHTPTHLVTSDGSATLSFRHPSTLLTNHTTTVTRLPADGGGAVEVAALNELEWADGLLYANVWMQPVVLAIDPPSGRVVHVWDASALLAEAGGNNYEKVLNGLAYRPPAAGGGGGSGERGRWYVTGKYWSTLYEVDLTLPAGRR